jgi:hypothetical protein
MDDALRDRVVAELRRNGYGESSDAELRRLADTIVGQTTAMRVAMVDLAEVFTRDTWPGRLLVRVADVASRSLARWTGR